MDKPKLVTNQAPTSKPTVENKPMENKKLDKGSAGTNASASQSLSQKEAVYSEVMKAIQEEKLQINPKQPVKIQLSEAQFNKISKNLASGFKSKKYSLKDTESNKKKLSDEKALEHYCMGLLHNWLRRDKRLNGTLAQK